VITAIVFVNADVSRIPEVAEEIAALEASRGLLGHGSHRLDRPRTRAQPRRRRERGRRPAQQGRRALSLHETTSRSAPTPPTTSSRRSASGWRAASEVGSARSVVARHHRPTAEASARPSPSRATRAPSDSVGDAVARGPRCPPSSAASPAPAFEQDRSRTRPFSPPSNCGRHRRCKQRRRRAGPPAGAGDPQAGGGPASRLAPTRSSRRRPTPDVVGVVTLSRPSVAAEDSRRLPARQDSGHEHRRHP
jgi:hypothetical protein